MSNPHGSMYNNSDSYLELNLRTELNRTLNGASDEIKKGRIGLLRRMRRNSDGDPIRCSCRDAQTDEPSFDGHCRYCKGMGFLWDERKIVYYKNEDSFQEGKGFLFYLQYDKDIDKYDYLIELVVDKEGIPVVPAQRRKLFKLSDIREYKSDRGRLEYFRARGLEERKWSVHYDIKNRQYP